MVLCERPPPMLLPDFPPRIDGPRGGSPDETPPFCGGFPTRVFGFGSDRELAAAFVPVPPSAAEALAFPFLKLPPLSGALELSFVVTVPAAPFFLPLPPIKAEMTVFGRSPLRLDPGVTEAVKSSSTSSTSFFRSSSPSTFNSPEGVSLYVGTFASEPVGERGVAVGVV